MLHEFDIEEPYSSFSYTLEKSCFSSLLLSHVKLVSSCASLFSFGCTIHVKKLESEFMAMLHDQKNCHNFGQKTWVIK